MVCFDLVSGESKREIKRSCALSTIAMLAFLS